MENLKEFADKELPILWLFFTEIVFVIFAVFCLSNDRYIEAILLGIFIEVRELVWRFKRSL